MVSEHRRDVITWADASLDPFGEGRMQVCPLGLRNTLVRHLTGDGVLERVLPFALEG